MGRKALVLMLLSVPALAQTTTVAGKLQTYSPNIAPNAVGNYVEFALTNCGNNTPQVSGVAVLLSKPTDFYPDATGALTAAANGGSTPSLYGNDVISCGGAFTSRYSVRYFVGGIAQGPAKFYYVTSQAPFDLTTALPINLQPPLNPPYPNLTKCTAGQYTIGLNKDLSVQCVNLPTGASNAVVTNPSGSQYIAQPAGTSFRPNEMFGMQIVDGLTNTTVQQAINAAGMKGAVIIPSDFPGVVTYTNPYSVPIFDMRIGGNFFYRQNLILPSPQFIQLLGTTGMLKADGTGKIVAAIAGTDYSSPGTGVTSFNTRTGAVSLTSGDVTGALGYTPPTPGGTGAGGTWNINVTGNAATAAAFNHVPTTCPAGQFATGVTASGNATGCAAPTGVAHYVSGSTTSVCTTGSSSYSVCNTNVGWTWGGVTPVTPVGAFCNATSPSDPRADYQVSVPNSSGVSVTVRTTGSVAVTYGSISCVGVY